MKFLHLFALPGTEDYRFFEELALQPEAALWMGAVADVLELGGVNDPVLARLLLLAGDATLSGDLCLRLTEERVKEAGRRLADRSGTAQIPDIRAVVQKAGEPDLTQRYPTIIAGASQEKERLTPFVLAENEGLLYVNKYFRLRRSLGRRLSEWWSGLSALSGEVSASQGTTVLTEEQLRAVREAMRRRFLIITGGPGTGKTTVIQGILSGLYAAGIRDNIWIAAPTGRAARRAHESASQVAGGEVKSGTIHRLLRSLPDRMPAAVIIDEVSMVDLELMNELLRLLDPAEVRLILIGDRNQLPSVDAGAVLGDLVQLLSSQKEASDCIVHLTKSHRSGDLILAAANAVNSGSSQVPWEPVSLEEFKKSPPEAEGCYWLDVGPGQIAGVMRQWSEMILSANAIEQILEAASAHGGVEDLLLQSTVRSLLKQMRGRVLAVTRQGKLGAEQLNTFIMQRLNRLLAASDALFVHGENWFSGMPLMVVRNDEARDVYNGETGILLRCGGVFRAVFDRGSRLNFLSLESLPESEPAFATTVHKSQGSEYDDVLIVLPEDATHPLISRQILYTAMTRARKRVFIAGRADVLAAAVSRKLERETGGLLFTS